MHSPNYFPLIFEFSFCEFHLIPSQGSDPLSMNDHYEKVFDAITFVEHNKKDKTIIEKMHGDGGHGHEVVQFSTPVRAVGTYRWIIGCHLF